MTDLRDDHPLMTRFPTELRRWRSVRRLSQLELAVRAGTTQRHVSFIEQGRSRPSLAELHLEAFLPADELTAEVLRRRWG